MEISHIGIFSEKIHSLNQYHLEHVMPYDYYEKGYINDRNFDFKKLNNYDEEDNIFIISVDKHTIGKDGLSDNDIKLLNSLKKDDVIIFDIDLDKKYQNISNIRKCRDEDPVSQIKFIFAEWECNYRIN